MPPTFLSKQSSELVLLSPRHGNKVTTPPPSPNFPHSPASPSSSRPYINLPRSAIIHKSQDCRLGPTLIGRQLSIFSATLPAS
ncbi:hypothetical protein E2562_017996 [Oryza meyeriana var. granulata]|uniref:Uncharacterized protein n=1 Tax=Oryza meyeriana var. granulata TaxID=110450 RepID=A0A6G1F941_9ORYZ|nr:hypothetical protein E2562_017996 [Oryza meyeriana var. granulata]